jgi:protein-S-isoprenylcysteine O-methyltransferase Ste14
MYRLRAALWGLVLPTGVGAIIFVSAGRWDLPWVWAVIAVLTLFYLALIGFGEPDMVCERVAPGPGNQDRLTSPLGGLLLVAHWRILAGWDLGRQQWSLVPWQLQATALAGYIVAMGMLFWAMRTNPFYSSVVRLQTERGHHTVEAGPYRWVRHPGYAATLFGMVTGGIALGSWIGVLPLLGFAGLFIRRTFIEDRLLQRELAGYSDYAERVRYRLVLGLF